MNRKPVNKKDGRNQAGSVEANSRAPSGTLQAGGEFLKALASDLAAMASWLRLSLIAKHRRTPRPPAPAGRIAWGPAAGRLLWRFSIVLLGLGSIGAGVLCALMLWVLFGFPLEARKSDADATGLRVESANGASLPRGGTPNVAAPSPPDSRPEPVTQAPPDCTVQPSLCKSGSSLAGSSSAGDVEPEKKTKETQADARAGSDHPQLARTETQDRRPAAPLARQQQSPGMSTEPRAGMPGMQCNVALCAERYKSFHAADCTYEPYGGGPRRICEASARSADASPQTPPATAPRSEPKDTESAPTVAAVAKPATPAKAGPQCNAALCAARYNTFNAADCTYQPYGGGPRSVCELSGRSAEALPQTPPVATAPRSEANDAGVAEKAAEVVPKPAMPARAGGQCNVTLCAARYSSFHAADCTYQPDGGGPRSLCDLSTRAADATPRKCRAPQPRQDPMRRTRQPRQGRKRSRNRQRLPGPEGNAPPLSARQRTGLSMPRTAPTSRRPADRAKSASGSGVQ